MITSAAQKAGFGGGLVVDYPNSRKARKMYLVLMVGNQEIPKGLDGEEASVAGKNGVGAEKKREEVRNERRRRKEDGKSKRGKKDISGKDWIMKKKELYRVRGKEGYVFAIDRSSKPISADADIAGFQEIRNIRLEREEFNSRCLTPCCSLFVCTQLWLPSSQTRSPIVGQRKVGCRE